MSQEIYSSNAAVKAIISGTAPRPAQIAAARGILPLSQSDLLEILVALAAGNDAELADNARATLTAQDGNALAESIASPDIAPPVLGYFARSENLPHEIHERILTNPKTPNAAVADFARTTRSGELLELISFNQQLLIRVPAIIEAIITNPFRTAEAERRASEIKREFFEKERGAQQIAGELRAQGKEAAAEFIENSEFGESLGDTDFSLEDAMFIAEHIEVPDSQVDDSWLSLNFIEELYEETDEQRQAIVSKIIGDMQLDGDEISADRVSMVARIMGMKMKDRVRMAMKGDREARTILIRDPNRIVAQAVIQNAKITEQEVEKVASMRSVPEDVLRLIAINRNWARNYQITHKLAQNPRTPIANVLGILTRMQAKDLINMSKNRNVSDAVRKQALRIYSSRKGK